MADPMQSWVDAMRTERFEEAWALSDADLAARDPATRDDPQQPYHERWVWDGRSFDERHVLVRCYHGLGDTLQFARYLPLLAQRCASVTVEVQPRLLPLLQQLPGIRFIPFDAADPLPPGECNMEICELAFALRQPPSAAPPPYLHATRAALPPHTIGLCYSAGDWDPARSVHPGLFGELCKSGSWLSLVSQPTDLAVLNPDGCPFDIGVTASLIAAVDLVITVDTMVAHLAGALGRPTWLMLKAQCDWRWTPGAPTTPWYPNMRLFTQPEPGDWPAVTTEVERALAQWQDSKGAMDEASSQPVGSGLVG